MTAAAVRTVVCGFCAREFTEDRGQSACGACPLTGGCRWVRCPYCGFENPETPAWMHRLARLLTSPGEAPLTERGAPDGAPLTLLDEGASARVLRLDEPGSQATAHLVALGVLPGVELTLLQRYPAFVMRIGHTEVAVDHELARRIRVAR